MPVSRKIAEAILPGLQQRHIRRGRKKHGGNITRTLE
ncbi:MAG: hypothetical protein RLZ97_912 [Verrucomicrobiota bacterium]|jgi:hypothetical protein